jgi:hypothetical protein
MQGVTLIEMNDSNENGERERERERVELNNRFEQGQKVQCSYRKRDSEEVPNDNSYIR